MARRLRAAAQRGGRAGKCARWVGRAGTQPRPAGRRQPDGSRPCGLGAGSNRIAGCARGIAASARGRGRRLRSRGSERRAGTVRSGRRVTTGMKTMSGRIAVLLAAAAVLRAPASAEVPAQPDALMQRMVAASQAVQSYTAAIHADIAMHSFPYLSPSLDGMYYHKEPSKNKIVFTSGLP